MKRLSAWLRTSPLMLALSSLAMPRARSVRLVEVPISQPLATAAAARRRWNDQPRR